MYITSVAGCCSDKFAKVCSLMVLLISTICLLNVAGTRQLYSGVDICGVSCRLYLVAELLGSVT